MRYVHRWLTGLLLAAAACLAAGSSASAATYTITYSGSGSYHTDYHSTPPNPGGSPDTNDAHDSSTQKWSITFDGSLTVSRCLRKTPRKRCVRVHGLTTARGETSAAGQINHTHVDGLYPQDNASASCQLSAQTPSGARFSSALKVAYNRRRHRIVIIAESPVTDVLTLLPQQCPSAPDGIDGLNDNYFMPGFSFAAGYGPARWFTSRKVTIPAARLRRAGKLTVPLGLARGGTPPKDCAVPQPSYEQCATGGTWNGTLTLTRKGR